MGVDHIFASPGSEWAPVWEALANPNPPASRIRYLSSRHEITAVGLATGYAKATGRLPAVMIHTTVGCLQAAMALRGAVHDQAPTVVFAGESIGFGEAPGPDPGFQWLRYLTDVGGPARLLESCVKWSFAVNTTAVLPATVQRACQLAMATPKGPVFVSLPMEFLLDRMTNDPAQAAAFPMPPAADPGGIAELARLLAAAKNPLIVTEEAGRSPAVVGQLVELAELIGAPVVETHNTTFTNFPRTHPLHGGFSPKEYLHEADLVFFVAAVAPWHPPSAGPGPETKVVVLDENPLHAELPYWGYRVDLCLTGAVESSLALLLERLRKEIPAADAARAARGDQWRRRYQERKVAWRDEALALKARKPMDPRWVLHELGHALPPDAVVVEETITHRMPVHRYLDAVRPGSYFEGCSGGLGTGLATALGVKVAMPDRPVVAVVGDGSFNYNPVLPAFGFAQEHRTPILVVLMNNHGYLSQKRGVPEYYPEGWAVRTRTFVGTSILPSPDYAALPQAFDGYGEKVEEPGKVRPAVERGLQAVRRGQMALLDVWLEPVN
jgi:thiamine pyrophosphate-dependent acetolactate synthase large subunit-like protein